MTQQDDNREIVRRPPPVVPGQPLRTIQLGQQDALDVTNLPLREQDVLEAEATRRAIERDDRAQRLRQDLTVAAAQINTFTKAVSDTTAQNAAVTITNTKDDSLGRTEMIFGNTDAARSGKLSRSQQGFGDNPKFWLLLAVIAGVVIVLVAVFKR